MDICEVARPVKVTHDVEIYRMIDEKQMEVKEGFLFEKIKRSLECSSFNRALRTFLGLGAGLTRLLGFLLEYILVNG